MYDQRRKRSHPESSSSRMDQDVIQIMPPITRGSNSKSLKQKQVYHEIIDVDMDDDSCYGIVIDDKGDLFNKGKETSSKRHIGHDLPGNSVNHNVLTIDLSLDDDEYFDMSKDGLLHDKYTLLQAQYDNVDIPPGVEAPIPLLAKKPTSAASPVLNSLTKTTAMPPLSLNEAEHSKDKMKSNGTRQDSFDKSSKSKMKLNITSSSSEGSDLPAHGDAKNLKSSAKSSKSWWCHRLLRRKNKQNMPNGTSHSILDKQPSGLKDATFSLGSDPNSSPSVANPNVPPGANPPISLMNFSKFKSKSVALSELVVSSTYDPYVHKPSDEEAFIPWVQNMKKCKRSSKATEHSSNLQDSISLVEENVSEDSLKSYELYKQFDTVQDHSDHHYSNKGSSTKRPSKNWTKHVQGDWRILEKNLPERIFVRVYETRQDLLRAVIIGAEGTPYSGGLFFFDVYFPSSYPSSPPNVYYHSGGLRLNPNLYDSGKVCLSLLNTWSGSKDEKWISGSSTMLQVLVSIQGLILNANPYFNEPAYAVMKGSTKGEKYSEAYNENTYLLSLKTMLYTMRKPPKHFEEFVAGHFRKYAEMILVECKAYMDGAQVGCLAKDGVQDVDEGDKSCSKKFKDLLLQYMKLLVKAFVQIGAKNCDRFLCFLGDKK